VSMSVLISFHEDVLYINLEIIPLGSPYAVYNSLSFIFTQHFI